MTAQQEETRRLIQACIEQGRRITAPAIKTIPALPPPGSFKTTPGPAQGVPYRSPYTIRNRKWVIHPKPKPRPKRKQDGLYIVAPVEPRSRACIDEQERRSREYFCRKATGLCSRCAQPAAVRKDGKQGSMCEGHLAKARAYQKVVRELGTEGERVMRGVGR